MQKIDSHKMFIVNVLCDFLWGVRSGGGIVGTRNALEPDRLCAQQHKVETELKK